MVIAESWKALAPRARIGIAAGVVLIACLTVGLGIWAYRADYQVLFADVSTADAAAMTAELDKQKVPYRLADNGTTILVPQEIVYKTRLKLMGNQMPLHGAVGFEVFNNADFGMTEFVQKVNYQRAIQGELTRTILAIEDVQAARVHLAIPEQGLFKKALTRPKASVTLTMKKDRTLAPEQVTGIQRLVAASVPDIASGDVTVLDQHGVALTRPVSADAAADSSGAGLEAKRGTESYLAKKVTEVLDRSFGAGVAVASIDVALNLDQSRITTEEVLPAKGQAAEGGPAGVIVRERHTSSEAGDLSAGAPPRAGGNSSTESDYQVGRRVEQLVPASGGIRRMTVAVLMRQPLTEDQVAKLKEVVMLAVGYNEARGDAIVVYPMAQFQQVGAPSAAEAVPAAGPVQTEAPVPARQDMGPVAVALAALTALVLLAGLVYLLRARRPAVVVAPVRLGTEERARMVADIRQWIEQAPVVTGEVRK
ncbi:flagellar basal-body MS-ring/collar protein FliF [Pseudoduganella chitinolytica]|uniref:Flagellar basal-body MS-ring/collar protein FliF n=1 Tax=Pseudoduganella chitinolytica TaxID=34070 RepID=A0ABY8BCX0_9BURK|nr:flagellar basal-body MS-ring/collar protein FliF [Pseudoduganella chitinolytica]WEF32848.1 flagellar basal-body MS-ring/collar protein FliF [Pseudoduganella chitinolytica]